MKHRPTHTVYHYHTSSLCFPLSLSSWPWCGLKEAEAFCMFITLPRRYKWGAGGRRLNLSFCLKCSDRVLFTSPYTPLALSIPGTEIWPLLLDLYGIKWCILTNSGNEMSSDLTLPVCLPALWRWLQSAVIVKTHRDDFSVFWLHVRLLIYSREKLQSLYKFSIFWNWKKWYSGSLQCTRPGARLA